MRLREALDLCADDYMDDWIAVPGGLPASSMVVGLLDSGGDEPATSILSGHTIAVYEPDPRLSMVWPVPDEDHRERRDRAEPEWLQGETHDWKPPRDPGWVVILLNGAPIWQGLVWYLDWGSGVGGYVAHFEPQFGQDDDEGHPSIKGWTATAWAIGLARLINSFSGSGDFYSFDPTARVVPSPTTIHPIDAARGSY